MQKQLQSLLERPGFEIAIISVIIASALSFGVRTFTLDAPLIVAINVFDYFVTVFFCDRDNTQVPRRTPKTFFLHQGLEHI